ncbi:hypothetical protein [Fimbriiglobus ruber]|uniref:Transmembrane protein n=1 Tax=Fimbriiglobus ruber TaxID=1908690 RepID=A0A225E1I8_9BACT|nr:hypothetical protein [Fimbriiglobus ruber]OWK45644.1 hypothetical protein FRUB_01975 [Fimbriiglobus ruber]
MEATAFGREELEHLRGLQGVTPPGNWFAVIGIPALVIACGLVFAGLSRHGQFARTQAEKQSGPRAERVPWEGYCMYGTLALCAVGTGALLLTRSLWNHSFLETYTIRLTYSLSPQRQSDYEKLLKTLAGSTWTRFFEIDTHPEGNHAFAGDVKLRAGLPKYLACNLDVYCLETESEQYFLFPDGVIAFSDNKLYLVSWAKVSLRLNDVAGQFRIKKYRDVMVHGRIRKDGGYDQRYNTRFERQSYQAWEPVSNYGVLSFGFGQDQVTVLTNDRSLAPQFHALFRDWLAKQ